MVPDFLQEARELFPYMQSLRRDFHRHPELGFQEVRTAGIVARELLEMGLEVQTGVAGTGVVALLRGKRPGRVVLARADMDALPINEESGAAYASQTPGVMHACGHDGHTAILLSVARLLQAHRDELAGTVKFVFQPAEEGMGGAVRMIEDGVLENPPVEAALALHLWNERPLGWLGIPHGPALAGAEIFKIKVRGKGGHGAAPHRSMDPILAASQMVVALQSIVARNIEPLKAAVVSVCTIHGGEAFNVIPQEVELSGTIRTFEPEVHEKVLERFEVIVYGLAETLGCQAELDLKRVAPAVINHADLAARWQALARQMFPEAEVDGNNYVSMGSEDMAFFFERVPGCFAFVGSANHAKGLDAGHHHPRFDFDEEALPRAAALLAAAVFEFTQ
jgi:amidohydrolase